MTYLRKLILIGLILFSIKAVGSEQYDFVKDFISVNHKLHQATTDFYDDLEKTSDPVILKPAVQTYVVALMESQNLLLKHSKADNEQIKEVSTNLRGILNDLTKNAYAYLSSVSTKNISDKKVTQLGEELQNKNNFASGFFREISFGIFALLAKEKPNNNPEKQYSVLTEQETDTIKIQLVKDFGRSIRKGTKADSETPFEYSSRMIYEFLNLEWEYEKK